jgi:hypothetical protein
MRLDVEEATEQIAHAEEFLAIARQTLEQT